MKRIAIPFIAALMSLLAACSDRGAPASSEMQTSADEAKKQVQPISWMPYSIIVPLEHLPKRYSCDELWYKFRDVLAALGARADMEILAYRCERGLGAEAYSPQVRLTFHLPRTAPDAPSEEVRIAPGQPKAIGEGDCVLLRQINGALLPALPVKVQEFKLQCATLSNDFHLTLAVPRADEAPAGKQRVAGNPSTG